MEFKLAVGEIGTWRSKVAKTFDITIAEKATLKSQTDISRDQTIFSFLRCYSATAIFSKFCFPPTTFAQIRTSIKLTKRQALALARAIVSTISKSKLFLPNASTVLIRLDADKYDLGYHIWDINPKDLVVKGEMQKNVRYISD